MNKATEEQLRDMAELEKKCDAETLAYLNTLSDEERLEAWTKAVTFGMDLDDQEEAARSSAFKRNAAIIFIVGAVLSQIWF